MVKKLSFKGDKPKSKKPKRVPVSTHKSTEKQLESDYDIDLIESGWSSATTASDLNGPILLTAYFNPDPSSTPPLETAGGPAIYCLRTEDEGTIKLDGGLDISEPALTINFLHDDTCSAAYSSSIHRSEPISINQVFVVVPLQSVTNTVKSYLPKILLDSDTVQVALKTFNGKYLSLNRDGLDGLSEAIGPGEIFELHRVVTNDRGIWWNVSVNGLKVVLLQDAEGKPKVRCIQDETDDTSKNNLFVIRVHSKNTVIGKRILNEHANKGELDRDIAAISSKVNNAIDSLIKFGLEVDEQMIKRLKRAAQKGQLNEQVINEKVFKKSDSRC